MKVKYLLFKTKMKQNFVIYNAKLLNGLENKATFKDIEMLYKNLQKDTNDKLKAIQNNTKKI